MKFEYRAKNEDGQEEVGEVEADSKGAALLKLQQRGYYVMEIEEKKVAFYERDLEINLNFFESVNDTDLIMFSRQLGIMLSSQIGIIESLRILTHQIEKDTFREVIEDIADRVEEGEPFSKALKRHDDVFSEFYIGAIESGEASGNLPQSLEYLEDHIERNSQFKKKLIGAMIYPLFIIFVFSFVVGFLLFFVIPDLVDMIEELDAEMPVITEIVIVASDFIVDWGLVMVGVIIAGAIGFKKVLDTEKGKQIFDETVLKLPVFGSFSKKVYLTYFAESMSTLISSGLDMVKALEVTENIVGNTVYKEIVAQTKQDVKEGKDISESLQQHPTFFPSLVTQMIIVGEKTGKMEKILNSVVKFYRDEVERSMESYIKIAEPALIILLGIVVGGLVMSVLLPIYNVGMGM